MRARPGNRRDHLWLVVVGPSATPDVVRVVDRQLGTLVTEDTAVCEHKVLVGSSLGEDGSGEDSERGQQGQEAVARFFAIHRAKLKCVLCGDWIRIGS